MDSIPKYSNWTSYLREYSFLRVIWVVSEVVARIEDRQTQLTQQSPNGIPVTLSTPEVDQIYEEVKNFKLSIIIIHLI